MNRQVSVSILLLLALLAFLPACSSELPNSPTVAILSFLSRNQYQEGEEIDVETMATDTVGIVRIDLLVDEQVVSAIAAPSPQMFLSVTHKWKATAGKHSIMARAYNAQNADALSTPVQVSVLPTANRNVAQPVPTAQPTTTPPTVFWPFGPFVPAPPAPAPDPAGQPPAGQPDPPVVPPPTPTLAPTPIPPTATPKPPPPADPTRRPPDDGEDDKGGNGGDKDKGGGGGDKGKGGGGDNGNGGGGENGRGGDKGKGKPNGEGLLLNEIPVLTNLFDEIASFW